MKSKINFTNLGISIAIPLMVGFLGSIATVSSVKTWYVTTLIKPTFNPPAWIFGPVWTFLFVLMGISLYIARSKKISLKWFWIQLLLNLIWSFLFFGLKLPLVAFIEIIFLWIAILMNIKSFWPKSKAAAILLFPYLFWVTFASFLNFTIARLN